MWTPRSLCISVLLALLVSASAQAAGANRVFLGLNGSNANDCANPATPCFSFAGALAQVAAGGEIIVEASGGYGPLNITQPVTINGAAGVVAFSGSQVTVDAAGATVVLRGLTIDGLGAMANGINVVAVGVLHVENCVITGFMPDPSVVGDDTAHGNGIFFGSSGKLFVKDTIVRGNGYGGIWIYPASGTAKASVDHCRLENNAFGMKCEPNGIVAIRDSVISGNVGNGLAVENGPNAELNVDSCLIAYSNRGIAADNGTVRVSNSTITDNDTGLFIVFNGNLLSRGNNTLEGNTTNGAFSGNYQAK